MSEDTDIYSLKLHQAIQFKDTEIEAICRVPGGWIYKFAFSEVIFIPFNNEFMSVKAQMDVFEREHKRKQLIDVICNAFVDQLPDTSGIDWTTLREDINRLILHWEVL